MTQLVRHASTSLWRGVKQSYYLQDLRRLLLSINHLRFEQDPIEVQALKHLINSRNLSAINVNFNQ